MADLRFNQKKRRPSKYHLLCVDFALFYSFVMKIYIFRLITVIFAFEFGSIFGCDREFVDEWIDGYRAIFAVIRLVVSVPVLALSHRKCGKVN